MVRIATVQDAAQLEILNNEFNGEGETTLENIRASLAGNKQEIVVVDEMNGELTGFVCVQLKKSFCYDEYMPEITEVYVKPQYRRCGVARSMIAYAEKYCKSHFPLHKFELLTGAENDVARIAYCKLGYCEDAELHLAKRFMRSKRN
jgi:ribosomal protein S18 acetylase RimI-like enzyme